VLESAVPDNGGGDGIIPEMVLSLYRNPAATSLEKWRCRLPKQMRLWWSHPLRQTASDGVTTLFII
jgi:hypothetical protein